MSSALEAIVSFNLSNILLKDLANVPISSFDLTSICLSRFPCPTSSVKATSLVIFFVTFFIKNKVNRDIIRMVKNPISKNCFVCSYTLLSINSFGTSITTIQISSLFPNV